MESSMATLLFIALLSERLVEIAKIFIKPFTENWNKARLSAMWQFLGLFSGIVLAFGLQINFLSIVGIKEAPWLGKLLAGIFAGMGTQWVHELITNLPYEIARSHRAQAELRKCTESRKKD